MGLLMAGVVHGKRIDLERETGLPAGAAVMVSIESMKLTLAERQQLVDELCGSWREDPSLGPVFSEIERRRAASAPRDADFDAPS